ncbi:MAG: Do family serine endopeptidase [Bacteroidota bacterium]
MMKRAVGAFLLTMLGSFAGVGIYKAFFEEQFIPLQQEPISATFSKYTDDRPKAQNELALPNFVEAVNRSRPAVVHIRSRYEARKNRKDSDFFSNPFRDFFDEYTPRDAPQGMATGSGVLISGDGYIVTNNHVIEDADKVDVTLFDNRNFDAEVIGTDPNTDLALLKIDAKALPFLSFGNSDQVQVGEWVLAVGNPMDLKSTVTAGIVSAKGRNINLLQGEGQGNLAIESFIQTDAAVNRGNSGGALVNIQGELVGINTAIASRTGTYAGYSFAIPSLMVKKVMEDLLNYGEVKRGFLGVTIRPVDARLAEEENLDVLKGAYITSVASNSGASRAGIRPGDVIISVNDRLVSNTSELQEQVSLYRPGDKITVNLIRRGEKVSVPVTLQGYNGQVAAATPKASEQFEMEGSEFRSLTESEKREFGTPYGIKVEKAGKRLESGGIQDGFVITEINDEKIRSVNQLRQALAGTGDFVTIKGLMGDGVIASYSFSW